MAVILCLGVANSINAGGTSYRLGNFTYYNDDNGNTYTSYSLGNFDYTHGSNGYYGSGYSLGDFYYWND